MRAAGTVLLSVVCFWVALAVVIFGLWVAVWSVSDIIAVGVNFWNVFWILLAGACFLGSGILVDRTTL